jgi:hypothetical protein
MSDAMSGDHEGQGSVQVQDSGAHLIVPAPWNRRSSDDNLTQWTAPID